MSLPLKPVCEEQSSVDQKNQLKLHYIFFDTTL